MGNKSILLAALLALTTSLSAFDNVKVSGYATAAGGYLSDKAVGANSLLTQPGHDGYNEEDVKFQPDSVAGLQVSSRIADDVTVSVQLVANFDNEDGEVKLEWAYINYELTDDLTIQAGRFVPEIFLYSSTVNVGYTYLWVTPPSELYDQAPMRYTDGINLMLDHTFFNDVTIEANAYVSNVSQDINFAGQSFPSSYENFIGGAVSISNEYIKLRAGHVQTDMSATLEGGFPGAAGYTSGGNTGIDNIEGLKADGVKGKFSTVGLTIDVADIIVIAEYGSRNIKDSIFTEDTISYYGTLAYRLGNFTPHITYSVLETDYKDSNVVVTTPDGRTPTIGFFRSVTSTDSETITAGLRYEINSKTALKFEYQNLSKSPQEMGATAGSLGHEETSADLYKIALSVIF